MKKSAALNMILFLLFLFPIYFYGQDQSIQEIKAEEEFRRGVNAFNAGFYNESILSLLKSISFQSDTPLVHEWLGRAYYYSGFEEAAVNEWQSVLRLRSNPVLRVFVDTVIFRRSGGAAFDTMDRYAVITSLPGSVEGVDAFSRPSGIHARRDGWFYTVAYGTNEVILMDTNGRIRNRYRGGISGFNRPFDAAESGDGYLYVTEYRGDRISKVNSRGLKELEIGSTGILEGELLGPQFIDLDDSGYLYVTEYGNRRVSKFSLDGSFVLSFGRKSGVFPGFKAPTGIAVVGEAVYVADKQAGVIYRFDQSGNYYGFLGAGVLESPEGITRFNDDQLLVADSRNLLLLNTNNDTSSLFADLSDTGSVINADISPNGTVMAADFQGNAVRLLGEMEELYAGLVVQVDRVNSDRFPEIAVDVTVQNRTGTGMVGLDIGNFSVTDGGLPVSDLEMTYAEYSVGFGNIMILAERSAEVIPFLDQMKETVFDTAEGITGRGSAGLVAASSEPFIADPLGSSPLDLATAAAEEGSFSDDWRFDAGLRLAGTELIGRDGKNSVLFVGNGGIASQQLGDYDLTELAAFLRNNGIRFYGIVLRNGSTPELDYLAAETGGLIINNDNPNGAVLIIDHLLQRQSGTYQLTYVSGSPSDFGRSYIPLEVQTIYLRRSGRGRSGYFAPLEF